MVQKLPKRKVPARSSIGDVVSQSLPVDYGAPRRVHSWPVLFTVYTNDLLTVPKFCQTACYVDDSKLYLKFKISGAYFLCFLLVKNIKTNLSIIYRFSQG